MIRKYQIGDEQHIDPVETMAWGKTCKDYVTPDNAWTREVNGQILGIGGIVPVWDNFYVYVIINKKTVEAKPSYLRGFEELQTLQKIVKFAESFSPSYIWTYIRKDFRIGMKLAKFLGFKRIRLKQNCWLYRKHRWQQKQD